MTTKEAYEHISNALKTDPDYAWSWHCNIAMAILDADDADVSHKDSNIAAAHVMERCFGVNTAENPNYAFREEV